MEDVRNDHKVSLDTETSPLSPSATPNQFSMSAPSFACPLSLSIVAVLVPSDQR